MLPPNVNTTQICFMQGIVIVTLDQGPINQGYMAREPGCSSKLGRSHSCCSLSKFHPLVFWLWGLVVVWGCLGLMVFICKFKHGYRRSTIVKLHSFWVVWAFCHCQSGEAVVWGWLVERPPLNNQDFMESIRPFFFFRGLNLIPCVFGWKLPKIMRQKHYNNGLVFMFQSRSSKEQWHLNKNMYTHEVWQRAFPKNDGWKTTYWANGYWLFLHVVLNKGISNLILFCWIPAIHGPETNV